MGSASMRREGRGRRRPAPRAPGAGHGAHAGVQPGGVLEPPPQVMWPERGSGFEADPFSPAGTSQRLWALSAGVEGRGRQALLAQMALVVVFGATATVAAVVGAGHAPAFAAVAAVVAVAAAMGVVRSWRAYRAADRW